MEIRVKINLVEDSVPFMGPGPLRLLEQIAECGSINRAAKEMKLSYVKALHMLNRLEQHFGRPLLIRSHGGNLRGGTELTGEAKELIREFRQLEEKIEQFAAREFKRLNRTWEKE